MPESGYSQIRSTALHFSKYREKEANGKWNQFLARIVLCPLTVEEVYEADLASKF